MRPTVAVGIGEAGLRMLSTLETVLEEERVDESEYQLLAIDTTASDIEDILPDLPRENYRTLTVDNDETWNEMREQYSYLEPEDTPGVVGGATRTRPVARAHLDEHNNFTNAHNFLEYRLDDFFDETHAGRSEGNVFLVNSLGGGTGSGTFLFLAAMIRSITDDLDTKCHVAGIGSLPRLDFSSHDFFAPGSPKHYANAYTALAELKSVVEHDFSTGALHIDVESNPDLARRGEWPLSSQPFDKYVLLSAVIEEMGDQLSREQINRVAANTVYYLASTRGLENFPDNSAHRDDVILTVDAAELSFPRRRAEKYVYQDELTNEIRRKKQLLERLVDVHDGNHTYVQDTIDLGRASEPPASSDVGSFVVSACRENANNPQNVRRLTPDVVEANMNSTVNDLASRVDIETPDADSLVEEFDVERLSDPGDDPTPIEEIRHDETKLLSTATNVDSDEISRDVVRLLYLRQLQQRLNRELEQNDFPTKVEESWSRHRKNIEEASRYEDADPETRWEEVLQSHLNRVQSELESSIEDQEGRFSRLRDAIFGDDELDQMQEKLEVVESELDTLQKLHAERDHINKTLTAVDTDVEEAIETVRDHAGDLEDLVEYLEAERERTERNYSREKQIQRSLVEEDSYMSLLNFEPSKYAEMELVSVEGLTEEALDQIRNDWAIDDFVASNLGDEETLRDNLDTVMGSYLGERVLDLAEQNLEYHPFVVLSPMIHADNDRWEQNVRSMAQSGQGTSINMVENTATIEDPLTIRLLAFFAGVDLEMASEYGTVHEYYVSDDKHVSDVLGDPDENVDIEETYIKFAYPELVQSAQ